MKVVGLKIHLFCNYRNSSQCEGRVTKNSLDFVPDIDVRWPLMGGQCTHSSGLPNLRRLHTALIFFKSSGEKFFA